MAKYYPILVNATRVLLTPFSGGGGSASTQAVTSSTASNQVKEEPNSLLTMANSVVAAASSQSPKVKPSTPKPTEPPLLTQASTAGAAAQANSATPIRSGAITPPLPSGSYMHEFFTQFNPAAMAHARAQPSFTLLPAMNGNGQYLAPIGYPIQQHPFILDPSHLIDSSHHLSATGQISAPASTGPLSPSSSSSSD